jgi:hypothetical protein
MASTTEQIWQVVGANKSDDSIGSQLLYPSFITLSRRKFQLAVELMYNGTDKPIHLTYESLKAKLQ